jgi:hypothetical protein
MCSFFPIVLRQFTYTLFSIILLDQDLNTKTVLMLVVLSGGMLTALTGTGISQVTPAFADKEECEDNDDDNCNERTHKVIQDDNCKAENEYEHIGSMDNPTDNNQFTCDNILEDPANGDDNEFGDSAGGGDSGTL